MKRGFGNSPKMKYGSNKVTYKGITFDSKNEMKRYIYLLDLQKKGIISDLRRQVKFVLIQKTVKLVPKQLKTKVRWEKRVVEMESAYHNDFLYKEDGKYVSEEFKSPMTSKLPDYVLRRKLMVKKIYEHNSKGRSQWVFREVVYYSKSKTVITDK